MIDEILDGIDVLVATENLVTDKTDRSLTNDAELIDQLLGAYQLSHLVQHSNTPLGLARLLMTLDGNYFQDDAETAYEEKIVESAFNLLEW